MKVVTTVTGMEEVLKKMGAASVDMTRAVNAAIWQEAQDILGKSVKQVPVKAGHLRGSAYAIPPKDKGGRYGEAEIGYGKKYALPVHDRHEVHHNVGKSNYLKDPFDEAQSGYVDRIARRAAVNFKGKIGVSAIRSKYPETTKE